MFRPSSSRVLSLLLLVGVALPARAQNPVFGRWDLTVDDGTERYPMWLELSKGAPPGGRLQPRGGHALALSDLAVEGPKLTFTLPSDPRRPDMPRFEGVVTGDEMLAEIVRKDGQRLKVTGRRAPTLARNRSPNWGAPVDLLANGLQGWTTRAARNGWSYANGELVNTPPSSDLISKLVFTDFRLQLEVNVPKGGNSGIYLRGRHEVQVQDDYGKPPYDRGMGGIYGQVQPMSLPARPAGEWQTLDITLLGRRVTVVLNGVTIINNQEIPGSTGGALDSNEAEPGPIMLQGDHSGVTYRNIKVTPAVYR